MTHLVSIEQDQAPPHNFTCECTCGWRSGPYASYADADRGADVHLSPAVIVATRAFACNPCECGGSPACRSCYPDLEPDAKTARIGELVEGYAGRAAWLIETTLEDEADRLVKLALERVHAAAASPPPAGSGVLEKTADELLEDVREELADALVYMAVRLALLDADVAHPLVAEAAGWPE